jgi:hypothetical protein
MLHEHRPQRERLRVSTKKKTEEEALRVLESLGGR